MKTYKKLYEKICSEENIREAYRKARKGKGKTRAVIEFERNLDGELEKLRNELISFSYRPRDL